MNSITIVIPTLNEERVITQRLQELSSLAVDEIIVVDGGSSDGTLASLQRFPGDLKLRTISAPRGRASQLNAGARAATSDILLFLHADVELPRDAVTHIEKALALPSRVAGCFKTWTIADPPRFAPWLHLADMRSRYSSLPYGDQALFLRAEVFKAVGGFPNQPLLEDYELSKALRRLGRIETVDACVRVSGRRFLAHPLRYCLITNTFPLLYELGVSSERLARLYRDIR